MVSATVALKVGSRQHKMFLYCTQVNVLTLLANATKVFLCVNGYQNHPTEHVQDIYGKQLQSLADLLLIHYEVTVGILLLLSQIAIDGVILGMMLIYH